MEFPGYTQIGEPLHRGSRSLVFRAQAVDGTPVIIKTPSTLRPSTQVLSAYQRAWNLASQAQELAICPHLELIHHRASVALVMADLRATCLRDLLLSHGLPLGSLLSLAVELATALARLHRSGILHRDIKPDNAILLSDAQVRWIDLGSAIPIGKSTEIASAALEGTVAYMAPEQCGRVHGQVDERSDLYSLGATLFELATGRPPFVEQDAAALAYAHVVQPPPLIQDLRLELPTSLSKIVDRLLKKNNEDRYNTANGLAHDLRRCLLSFQKTGTIHPFEIGQVDTSSRFRIPNRLYGRDLEIALISEALDQLNSGQRIFFAVGGQSGIGKTALVLELQRLMSTCQSNFCAGKFDQYRTNLPYLGILLALRALIRRELAAPENRIATIRKTLQQAVGVHGRLLTDQIPELQNILGPQSEVEDIPPMDATRRFHGLIVRFISGFATAESPLGIFIDDLQWADPPSLHLLEALGSHPGLQHLMIIVGYRTNEIGAGHPARQTLKALANTVDKAYKLELNPLTVDHITALVADTVHRSPREVRPISERIATVAAGNPFFVTEFLKSLLRRRFFVWNDKSCRWTWNNETFSEQKIPNNIAQLLTERLNDLPADSMTLLNTASCVGSEFSLRTLEQVHESTVSQVACGLGPAVNSGLIVPMDHNHVVLESLASWTLPHGARDSHGTARYRFQHDQVRQTVHERLDTSQQKDRHLQIGRLLLLSLTPEELSLRLVEVFDHVMFALDRITEPQERNRLAKLGLRAGQSAIRGLAFDTAVKILQAAISLLPPHPWLNAYKTTLQLHIELAQCHHARSDYTEFEKVAEQVIAHAKSTVDASPAHGLRIRFLNTQTRYEEAVDDAIAVAKELGIALPRKPHLGHLLWGVARALFAQGRTKAMRFTELPDCKNIRVREAILILTEAASSAYFAEPNLLPLIGITSTRLSLKWGITSRSPYGFAVWALVLSGVLGLIERGRQFGDLALAVGRRYGGVEEARARFVTICFVNHWSHSLEDCTQELYRAWAYNRDSGDEESATYSAGVMLYTQFFSGVPFDVRERYPNMVKHLHSCQQPHVKDCFLAWVQLSEALEQPEFPNELSGEWYRHAELLPGFQSTNNGVQIAISSVASGILAHLAGRLEKAKVSFALAARYEDKIVGQVIIPGLAFFQALNAYLLVWRKRGSDADLKLARKQRRRLRKWAKFAPVNLDHRLAILDACDALICKRPAIAVLKLHTADGTCEQGAVMYQAIARTLLVEIFERRNNERVASEARRRAREAWLEWGCPALGNELFLPQAQDQSIQRSSLTDTVQLDKLDMETLLNSVAAISEKIDQKGLVNRLMDIVLKASGADRGLMLLLERTFRAEVEAKLGEPLTYLNTPVSEMDDLAHPVLDLARRSHRTIVIHDAAREEILAEDAHIAQTGVKAIMISPISLRGETLGWLYLENHFVRGAFPPERVTLIEALGAQAGIALENAQFYQTLEDKVTQRTTQLAAANAEITQLNDRLKAENLRMSAELDVAQRVQKMILPKPEELAAIPNLDIAGYMTPADEVGGDYYDVLIQDGVVTVGIGDVTGHGLESGLVMMMAQTTIRTLTNLRETDPVRFLNTVNATIYDNVQRMGVDRNLTLAILTYIDGQLSISGQHEEVLLVRANGELEKIDTLDLGLTLGLIDNIADFIDQTTLDLQPGDGIVLYTDGITEALNENRDCYGLKRLCKIVQQHWLQSAQGMQEKVIADVYQFIGSQKVIDDITLLILKQL